MGMHSFELSSQCSFLCGWLLFVVLSVVLKFHIKAASAGTLRGRINLLTIEMAMSSIMGKYIAAQGDLQTILTGRLFSSVLYSVVTNYS